MSGSEPTMSLAERLSALLPEHVDDTHACGLCSQAEYIGHKDYFKHEAYLDRLVSQNKRMLERLAATSAEVAELRAELREESARQKATHSAALHEISRLEGVIEENPLLFFGDPHVPATATRDHLSMSSSAMWETERTEDGFDVVVESDENRARAYDYVVERIEGAGIHVQAKTRRFGGGDIEIEFRGEEATIVAPLPRLMGGPLRIAFLREEPDPEHIIVALWFGPRNEYRYEGLHLHSVTGSVGDVIALIQS